MIKFLRTITLVILLTAVYIISTDYFKNKEVPPPSKEIGSQPIVEEVKPMSFIGTADKKALFMKIFTAELYLSDGVDVENVLTDVEKKIDVHYFYPIPAKKLSQYTKNQMKLNTSGQEFAELSERLETMDQLFVDLKPEDRYTLHYIPGLGTKFIYNNQEVGIIEGSDFGKSIFAVWLGDNPMDRQLKEQILGVSLPKK